jgi:2-polyprenyl-3-methyl-5-hydroxy-6-metoxy-1,4-benzoquinol methylase
MQLPVADVVRQEALAQQIDYFATRRPVRLLALDTPYIRRHFDQVVAAGALHAGEAVCEWGAGLGRFSRLLLDAGLDVTAIELSPQLSEEARAALGDRDRLSIQCGDIASTLEEGTRQYDAMTGFFVLHHLPQLERYFRAARRALHAGGRMVFVEPNPFHPLFPVQIALTPGMRWRAERGIYRLTPRALRAAALAAGFSRVEINHYGALPRAPYNLLARSGMERAIEPLVPGVLKPFQSIVAWC